MLRGFEILTHLWKHAALLWEIKFHERKFENGLKYLFYDNHSDELLIVFSAFGSGNRRTYNYVRTLKNSKVDRLYILDPWGYKGSYNLYVEGNDFPSKTTNNLIDSFLQTGQYKKITMAGSSKGGSCALFFGLHHKVNRIVVGACQYNIGTYVSREDFKPIFYAMMGMQAGERERMLLDSLIKDALDKASDEDFYPEIHVLFSRKELTCERQIKDLLKKLEEKKFPTILKEENFEDHSDVGKYFGPYLRDLFEV